jgi:hypothetical protein
MKGCSAMHCSIPGCCDPLLPPRRLQQKLEAFLLPTLMDEADTATAKGI